MVAQFMNSKSSGRHAKDDNSSYIYDDCEHLNNLMSEYNCSCLKKHLYSNFPIRNVLWPIFAFIVFLFVLELVCIRCKRSFMDNFFGKLVFSVGIVSSIVTQFCTVQRYILDDCRDHIVDVDVAVLTFLSIFFITFGGNFLFVKSQNNNIGSHDRGMGVVVIIISLPILFLECWSYVMKLDALFSMVTLFYTIQKYIQAGVYLDIRRCNPHPDFRRGAVFYFNFVAFLNFTLWLSNVRYTDMPIYCDSPISQYVEETFKALLIDYRLLFVLLFLEHAIAIDGNTDENEHMPNRDDQGFEMPERRKLCTVVGVGIGLVFLLFEIISSVGHFPPAVNILHILVDIFLAVLGVLLLKNVNCSVFHNKKANLVLLMVSSMGATSIVYLFCFSILSFTLLSHDEPVPNVMWSGFVCLIRAFSLLVLLNVYTGISVGTMESRENHNTKNYILVSALCTGLFARFIGNMFDEFKEIRHHIARHHLQSSELRSLQYLFAFGPLFQLAASLHLALHFLLLLCRLHEKPKIAHQAENDVRRPGDENVRSLRDNYGAVAGVAREPNVDDVVSGGDDSVFELSGARQSHSHGEEHDQTYNERSRLL